MRATPPPAATDSAHRPSRGSILVIDDEADVLETLGSVLGQEGFQVTKTRSGAEGLHLFQTRAFDLVITDYRMPGMDGLEVVKRIKRLDPDMEVVILTGFATLENAIQALRHGGAFDYLNKPLRDIETLLITAEHAIEKRQLVLENTRKAEALTEANERLEQQVEVRLKTQAALASRNRALKMVSECNKAVIHAADEADLLERVCDIVVKQGGYHMAWVGTPAPHGAPFGVAAMAGFRGGIIGGHHSAWGDMQSPQSATGRAVRSKGISIDDDIRNLSRCRAYRDAALENGCASAIAFPLLFASRLAGVFTICSECAHAFNAEELELLSEISMNLCYGMHTIRTREDRKKALAAFRESEEKYRILINNASDAIFIVQENAIKFANPRTCELLACSQGAVPALRFFEMVHPEDRKEVFHDHSAASQQANVRHLQSSAFRLIDTAGAVHWVLASSALISWEDRPASLLILKDTTARREMEEQLTKSQKMEALGTLAGGIAHDFKNILAAIVGFNELAKLDLPPSSRSTKHLAEITQTCMRARELIKQILTFSRRTEKCRIPVSMKQIVEDTLKMVEAMVPGNIDIRTGIGTSASILADPTQIQRVIMNLAGNAVEAMSGKPGVLTLALDEVSEGKAGNRPDAGEEPQRWVRLTVSDTGCGMDNDTIRRIFDPYFSTRREKGGTGLGLSVVHGIVTQNDGRIEVASRMGGGTSFQAYFPLQAAIPQ